jgi:hypothetical protein
MKTRLFLLNLFVLLSSGLSLLPAQHWQPLRPSDQHYAWLGDGDTAFTFIKIDSAEQVGPDSVYYLNTIITPCDTCVPPPESDCYYQVGDPLFLRNQAHFLQKKLRFDPSGKYHSQDTGSFVLFTEAKVGETWLFDTLAGVRAEVHSLRVEPVFGYADSVKKILLSSGDTIRLARNHGLVQFPMAYGSQSYYRIKGIQGKKLGIPMPRMRDFFDFAVGDRFEYHSGETGFRWGSSSIEQYRIVKKEISENGWKYSIEGRRYNRRYNSSDILRIYENSEAFSRELIFEDSSDHILNRFYTQLISIGSLDNKDVFVQGVYNIQGSFGGTLVKFDDDSPIYCVPNHDTIKIFHGFNGSLRKTQKFESSVGLTYEEMDLSEYHFILELAAFQRGDSVYGTFSPDSLFEGNDSTEIPEIPDFYELGQNYPNPAITQTVIPFSLPDTGKVILRVLDTRGRVVVVDERVWPAGEQKMDLDVSSLPSGLYYYTLIAGDFRQTRLMMVRH